MVPTAFWSIRWGAQVAVAGGPRDFATAQDFLRLAIAGIDLVFAAGWLVASRLGVEPLGFDEPIVLLAAVHFHFAGFVTAVMVLACVYGWGEYVGAELIDIPQMARFHGTLNSLGFGFCGLRAARLIAGRMPTSDARRLGGL